MAYISQNQEDDDPRPRAPGALTDGIASPASPPAPAPAPAPGAAPPSRFVSFGRFLAANADTAGRTADSVASGIEQQGAGLQRDVSQTQQAYAAGLPQPAPYNDLYDAPGFTGRSVKSPTLAASISSRPEWADFQARARGVEDQAAATSTPSGLGGLLQQRAQGVYGGGDRRLDEALTGAAGGNRFADVRSRFGNFLSTLQQADAASRQAAAQNLQANTQAANAERTKLNATSADYTDRDLDKGSRATARRMRGGF